MRKKALRNIIADNVKWYRILSGKKQKALAKAAHVSPSSITQIEQAKKNPGMCVLERIAIALGVEPYKLLMESKIEVKPK